MKKIFVIMSVAAVLIVTVNYFTEKEGMVNSLKSNDSLGLIKTTAKKNKLTQEIQGVVASNEIPSIEDLESDFLKKSDKEISRAIENNNSWAEKNQFIAKANANALDKQDSAEFLKYVRLNSALHKILLDRQIDALEQETL